MWKYELEEHVNDWFKDKLKEINLENQVDYFTESAIPEYLKIALNWLFLISAMTKSFSSFTWWSSSFNINIIWNQEIQLPINNNQPDYEIMENLISAVQKIVVMDVVGYCEGRM